MGEVIQIKSPINYNGGKRRIAQVVWDILGDPDVYIEPFAGTAAVLLDRPHRGRYETLNDADPFICNFHRAIKHDPGGTAYYADDVVDEIDVRAKRNFLIQRREFLVGLLQRDPEFFDIRCAGFFAFLSGLTIGTLPPAGGDAKPKSQKNGIFSFGYSDSIKYNFERYSARMRQVRVLFGDWLRAVKSESETGLGDITGIFLDPPYAGKEDLYSQHSTGVAHEVREWCIANGENTSLRIVLAGYLEHEEPMAKAGWRVHKWKATGGYGNQADGEGRANAELERLYISPHALDPSKGQLNLLDGLEEAA